MPQTTTGATMTMKAEDLPMFLRGNREEALLGFAELIYEIDGELTEATVSDVVREAVDHFEIDSAVVASLCVGIEGSPDHWKDGKDIPSGQDDRRAVVASIHEAVIRHLSRRQPDAS